MCFETNEKKQKHEIKKWRIFLTLSLYFFPDGFSSFQALRIPIPPGICPKTIFQEFSDQKLRELQFEAPRAGYRRKLQTQPFFSHFRTKYSNFRSKFSNFRSKNHGEFRKSGPNSFCSLSRIKMIENAKKLIYDFIMFQSIIFQKSRRKYQDGFLPMCRKTEWFYISVGMPTIQ